MTLAERLWWNEVGDRTSSSMCKESVFVLIEKAMQLQREACAKAWDDFDGTKADNVMLDILNAEVK